MEAIIIQFHKDIVKSIPKGLRPRFDILFGQVVALQPTAELLKGLTIQTKLVVIKRAVLLLDEEQLQLDPSFQILYTPAVSATFNALIAMAKFKSDPIRTVPKSTSQKDSALSVKSQPVLTEAQSAKDEIHSRSVEPEPKGKPRKVRIPKGEKLAKVYSDLQAKLCCNKHVFATSGFKFINCDNVKCAFCRSLFVNFQLTRCRGHSKCTPSGWYPHFGPQLWNRLARYHNKNNGNTHFKPQNRELKVDELASFSSYGSHLPSMTPPREPIADDDDDTSSTSTITSSSSYRSSKRGRDFSGSESWIDEVERMELGSPKRHLVDPSSSDPSASQRVS